MDVVKLLQSKNRCLKRLLKLSLDFIGPSGKGDLTRLSRFELERDAILKTLDLYDRKITEAIRNLPLAARTPELLSKIRRSIHDQENILAEILTKDNEILSWIGNEKITLQQAIFASERSRSIVEKFKSTWVHGAGKELDSKL